MTSTAAGLWGETVTYLNQRNSSDRFQIDIYLNYLTPETVSDSELVVSTDNSFVKTWVERHFSPDIKDAIFNVAGRDLGFRIVITDRNNPQKTTYQQVALGEKGGFSLFEPTQVNYTGQSRAEHYDAPRTPVHVAAPAQPVMASVTSMGATVQPIQSRRYDAAPDHPSYVIKKDHKEPVERKHVGATDERTFDSFIVGDSNRYAYSTALGVAQSPGNIYNPLFIYGKSGLGKTHLLVAIENYIKTNQPYLKTTYAQTSDFFSDFTMMLHDREKRREFEQRYHNVDVILLDDVQYLEGKEATTNEVFQILNSFISKNKQVVLSADRPPFNIAIDERHTSRYASGPTIDIQPPDFDMKYAIFVNYFDYCCRKIDRPELKELMTREIIERVIELSSDNIRELNGATASLVAYLSIRQNKFDTLTIEEVEKRVLNVFMKNGEKRIDIAIIQKEIEGFYKVNHNDLLSKKRSQGISYPRQVAMYLSRNLTGESYPDIGKAFGGKDHTSVMYACNQIEQKRQESKKIDKEIESLIKAIKS